MASSQNRYSTRNVEGVLNAGETAPGNATADLCLGAYTTSAISVAPGCSGFWTFEVTYSADFSEVATYEIQATGTA